MIPGMPCAIITLIAYINWDSGGNDAKTAVGVDSLMKNLTARIGIEVMAA